VSIRAHVMVVVLALAAILFIIRLVRQRRLRAKYSVLWLSIGFGLAILAAFPNLLVVLSDLLGVEYPPAVFFALALSFLLLLCLHFSWEISRLEDRTRALAEEHALLKQMVVASNDHDANGADPVNPPGERHSDRPPVEPRR
jgi:hypothetical protein